MDSIKKVFWDAYHPHFWVLPKVAHFFDQTTNPYIVIKYSKKHERCYKSYKKYFLIFLSNLLI